MTAIAILLFKELDILFRGFSLLKLLINTQFPVRETTAAAEHIVDGFLRKDKLV